MADQVCPVFGDNHHYAPAGILAQARQHVITKAMMQRPSLVVLCPCGQVGHAWVPEPPPDAETQPPPGGILKPLDGRP